MQSPGAPTSLPFGLMLTEGHAEGTECGRVVPQHTLRLLGGKRVGRIANTPFPHSMRCHWRKRSSWEVQRESCTGRAVFVDCVLVGCVCWRNGVATDRGCCFELPLRRRAPPKRGAAARGGGRERRRTRCRIRSARRSARPQRERRFSRRGSVGSGESHGWAKLLGVLESRELRLSETIHNAHRLRRPFRVRPSGR